MRHKRFRNSSVRRSRPGWYVFILGFREFGFQTVVARASRQASRPCVGCTICTGGTPVPLPWKRSGRSNFLCLTACRAWDWLNTYLGRGFERRVAARSRPRANNPDRQRDADSTRTGGRLRYACYWGATSCLEDQPHRIGNAW